MKIMVLMGLTLVASASTSAPPQPTELGTEPEPSAVTEVTPSSTLMGPAPQTGTSPGTGPTQVQGTSQPSPQGTSAPSTAGPEPSAVTETNVVQETTQAPVSDSSDSVEGTSAPPSTAPATTSDTVSEVVSSTTGPEPSAVLAQPSTSSSDMLDAVSTATATTGAPITSSPSTSAESNQVMTTETVATTQAPLVQTTSAPQTTAAAQTTAVPQTTAPPVSVTTVTFEGVTAQSFADNQDAINLSFFKTMQANLPSLTNVSQIESEIVTRRRRLLSGVQVAFKIKGLSKNDVTQSAAETGKGNFASALATEVSNSTPLTVQVKDIVTVAVIYTLPPVVQGTTGTPATTLALTTGKPKIKATIVEVEESSSNVGAILGGLFGALVFMCIVYYVYTTQCATEPYNEFDADPEKNGPCDHVQMSNRDGKSVYLD